MALGKLRVRLFVLYCCWWNYSATHNGSRQKHLWPVGNKLPPILQAQYTLMLYYIKDQEDATLAVLFISHCKNYSTCFGRFLLPSSGVLKTVVAATGACHGSEWYISSKDVRGWLPLHSWWWKQKASETCRVILAVTNKQYCQSCILLVL